MPTRPDPLIHLPEQSRLLGEVIAAADPETPVPTCPDWTLRTLAGHVGRGDRWAAEIVDTQAQEVVDPRTVEGGDPPADPRGIPEWLADGVARLTGALAATGAGTRVWTFLGPRPAAWWVRRRLHETVAHRADAALATGGALTLAPELGADAVSEWLDLVAARSAAPGAEPVLDDGATLHLHATDGGLGEAGEWTVHRDGTGIAWEHGHAKGSVAVRGAAADLHLMLLRRLAADDPRLQVFGDPAVLAAWLARTPF
ncbi:MAG TPA: maleylpyruvate isomerase family mycothiol-dependent enzyme [Pseudonocardia sp.]|nr:maleylpyruvate isomerase family mycothiol-dependent enzyme [Pseudonocardia sp.]